MPVRRRLEGDGAATWLPFAESKLRLLKDRIRRYPGHIRTQWLTTDNGTDIYLEAGAIDEIVIKTATSSGGVAVLYVAPYQFLVRVYSKDTMLWETVQPMADLLKNRPDLRGMVSQYNFFERRFSVSKDGSTVSLTRDETVGVPFIFSAAEFRASALNKKGVIGATADIRPPISYSPYFHPPMANAGSQWGSKAAVLWQFGKHHDYTSHPLSSENKWSVTKLAGGALQTTELHSYEQAWDYPAPVLLSYVYSTNSGVAADGRMAYVVRDYVWPQFSNVGGTYSIIDDTGAVLASAVVSGDTAPFLGQGTMLKNVGFFADGSFAYTQVSAVSTGSPGYNLKAKLVHGDASLLLYEVADTTQATELAFYADMVDTPSLTTGAEVAVVSIYTGYVDASWVYDSKLKKLFALPLGLGSVPQQFLIDNKNRRVIVDLREVQQRIVTFSVVKGALVRTDYAMPAGYPPVTGGALLALVDKGEVAASGSDGYTTLALGTAVTVTKDAFKKQRDPVVKDGQTFAFRALAFSGNAHHLG